MPEGVDDEKFREIMDEEQGVVITGGFGPLREDPEAGLHGKRDGSDIQTTVDAMAKTFSKLGYQVDPKRVAGLAVRGP